MEEVYTILNGIVEQRLKNSATYKEALSMTRKNSYAIHFGNLGNAIDQYINEKIIKIALSQSCNSNFTTDEQT